MWLTLGPVANPEKNHFTANRGFPLPLHPAVTGRPRTKRFLKGSGSCSLGARPLKPSILRADANHAGDARLQPVHGVARSAGYSRCRGLWQRHFARSKVQPRRHCFAVLVGQVAVHLAN